MDTSTTHASGQEWAVLQNLYERYEFAALWIKLVAVMLFVGGAVVGLDGLWLMLVMALLWLQEGIFKNFQTRLGVRLLAIEQDIARGDAARPYTLHTDWLAQRKGVRGLVREYLESAMRPTVAFPYLVLLLWALWLD